MPHEKFMARAFFLALRGSGKVSPNPLVGCVIVHENKVIGEGWHEQYGGPHAEVNAVQSVGNQSVLSESTVYVTLEPCSHFGKTPPCADLLIRHKVKRVVVANTDPNPLVAGRGISALREAGITVEENCLAEVGREINRRFFTFFEKKRPYLVLKWAESADGFMAIASREPVPISNEYSRLWVHRWRSEEDAILVGTTTARLDNPRLNVRAWHGKNPLRIILDKDGTLPQNLYLFADDSPTICYTSDFSAEKNATKFVALHTEDKYDFLPKMLTDLYAQSIASILVEGGASTLQSFIDAGLWDEIRVIKAKKILQNGVKSPEYQGIIQEKHDFLGDIYTRFKPISAVI